MKKKKISKEKTKKITNSAAEEDDDEDRFMPKKENPKSKTPVLDSFGRDLTRAAEEKKLDPIVGREHEVERVCQILSRRKKNSAILIGEAGCVTENIEITIRKISDEGSHLIIEIN